MALPAFTSPFAPELKIISVLIEMGGNVAAFSRLRFFFNFFLVFRGWERGRILSAKIFRTEAVQYKP